MTIAERLRAYMKATGATQIDVARHIGTNQSTVSRWLQGAEPEPHHLDALQRLLRGYELPAGGQPHVSNEQRVLGDENFSPEAVRLLKEVVGSFLGGFHPKAADLWREACELANPFPEDMRLSPEERDLLLEEAEIRGKRARIRANRQTDSLS